MYKVKLAFGNILTLRIIPALYSHIRYVQILFTRKYRQTTQFASKLMHMHKYTII